MKFFLLFFISAVTAIHVTIFRLPLPFFTIELKTPARCNTGQTSLFSTRSSHTSMGFPSAGMRTSTLPRTSVTSPSRSSVNHIPQVQRLTPLAVERQGSIISGSTGQSMNVPAVEPLSEGRQPEASMLRTSERQTRPSNNRISTNLPSTRSSVSRLQPQRRVMPSSTLVQNAVASSSLDTAPSTRTSTNEFQETETATPGNVARQASLLMSRNRGSSNSLSARTSTRTSTRGPSCVTPDGENGICGHISECKLFLPYIDMLDQPDVLSFFRERVCRLLSMEMHICCPTSPMAKGPQLRSAASPAKSDCGAPSTNRLVGGREVSSVFGSGC